MNLITGLYQRPNEPMGESTFSKKQVSEKDKIHLWYSKSLQKMSGDDGFVFLTVCFPLLETIIRHELEIPVDQDVTLSDGSPALHWFAKFMTIPDANAREVWDSFRNGLLHRSMIKGSLSYELSGSGDGRPAIVEGDIVKIFVWDLRDLLLSKLEEHNKRLWSSGGSSTPDVYRVE